MNRAQYITLFSLSLIMFILGVVVSTVCFLDNEIIAAVLSLLIFCIFGIILFIIFICDKVNSEKHNKEIAKWITDENLFETIAKPWEFSSDNGFVTHFRFGLDFEKDGKAYRKISSHYDAFYKIIKNKEIRILYSPKYDEVMVIDRNNETKVV